MSLFGSRWSLETCRKTTTFLTTKVALYQQFQFRCDGSHEHCPLEGHAKGFGMRTKYLEKYQPAFATVLAAALLATEVPTIMDFVGAVAEDQSTLWRAHQVAG